MIRLKSLLTEGSGPLTDNWLKKGIWIAKELMKRGFTETQASAIVGNMWAESTFDSTSVNNIGAIGLLQWLGSRATALKQFAKKRKKQWHDFQTQLDFIVYELKTKYNGTYGYETNMFNKHVKPQTHPGVASEKFARFSERPKAYEIEKSLKTRIIAAKNVYDALTGSDTSKTPDTQNKQGVASGAANVAKNIHVVKAGEVASIIASKHKITIQKLKQLNPSLTDINKIQVGQKLRVG